jgi:hypothetical protein
MKTSIRRSTGEHYFGIEITPDGKLVFAERMDGRPLPATSFPAGDPGARALREHIELAGGHPHIRKRTTPGSPRRTPFLDATADSGLDIAGVKIA